MRRFFLFCFSIIFPYFLNANSVNLLVKYDIITFSTFKDIIKFNAEHNIKQYIQYNSIIPIFLAWNNPESLKDIKKLVSENNINFFQYKNNLPNNKQSKWFLKEKKTIEKSLFKKINVSSPILINKNNNFLNILNFIELKKILTTLNHTKFRNAINFKMQPDLFLYNNVHKYFETVKDLKTRFNFLIYSDKEYQAPQQEINKFIDLLYTLKKNKTFYSYEKNIYNLALYLFIYKIESNLNNIFLTLFPLSNSLQRRYFISSMAFSINKRDYITLYDKKNYIIFDKQNSILKKFFYYKRGICLINNDSLIDEIYLKKLREPHYSRARLLRDKYFKFENGISFHFNDNNLKVSMEKNIIMQYNRLIITYKIKNNASKKKSFILVVKNNLSPSLGFTLKHLINSFALYNGSKKPVYQLTGRASGIINTATGYGISISSYNRPSGLEVFKNFYNYGYNIYYKFSLYPFEKKTITLYLKRIYLKNTKKYKKTLNNLYWGDYEIK